MFIRDKLKEDEKKADEILSGKPAESVAPSSVETPIASIAASEVVGSIDKDAPIVPSELDKTKSDNEELKKQLDKEKSRYLSLQGMFNKMNEDLKIVKKQVEEKPSIPVLAPKPTEVKSDALDKLKNDYGDDIADVISKLAKIEADKIVSEKLKEHGEKITKVEETAGQTKQEIFFSNLAILIPDWKTINGWENEGIPQDPKWTEFLFQEVPGTTMTYSKVLSDGYAKHDAQAVAKVFNLYKKAVKPETPEESKPPTPPVSKIDEHIDPGSGGAGSGGAPPVNDQKKYYTQKEVDAFYNSIAKKTFVGTYAERKELESEYNDAIIEGRVTQ